MVVKYKKKFNFAERIDKDMAKAYAQKNNHIYIYAVTALLIFENFRDNLSIF